MVMTATSASSMAASNAALPSGVSTKTTSTSVCARAATGVSVRRSASVVARSQTVTKTVGFQALDGLRNENSSQLRTEQGSLAAGCSSPAGSSSGRACSVSARGPSWRTVVREHRLLCVSQARRTWQVRAKPQRQKEDEDEDIFFPEAEEIDREALQAFLDLELQTNYDLDDGRHYEIMFLIPENEVEKVPDVIKKVEAFVAEQKGKIWRVNDWGLRRLAYKIKKAERANYVLMNIEMKAAAINQLNTMFEKDERVIRHMCISQKEAYTEDTVSPPNYYSESADGAEAQEEDDSDDEDDEEEEEEEEEEEDEASSSQENRGWDQIVQGQESSVAL